MSSSSTPSWPHWLVLLLLILFPTGTPAIPPPTRRSLISSAASVDHTNLLTELPAKSQLGQEISPSTRPASHISSNTPILHPDPQTPDHHHPPPLDLILPPKKAAWPPATKPDSQTPEPAIITPLPSFHEVLHFWKEKIAGGPPQEVTILKGSTAVQHRVSEAVKKFQSLNHQSQLEPQLKLTHPLNKLSRHQLEELWVETRDDNQRVLDHHPQPPNLGPIERPLISLRPNLHRINAPSNLMMAKKLRPMSAVPHDQIRPPSMAQLSPKNIPPPSSDDNLAAHGIDTVIVAPKLRDLSMETPGTKLQLHPAKMSRLAVDLPPARKPIRPLPSHQQSQHIRLCVIWISRMWHKEPSPLTLLSSPQTLAQKHRHTSIHIFLDPELHKQITALYNIFSSIVKKKAAPPHGMTLPLEKPPLPLTAPSHRGVRASEDFLEEDKKVPISWETRSLFQFNAVNAISQAFKTAKSARTQFLKSVLDRGTKLYSEVPKSHPFDETRKAKMMSTIKTWGASSQETVGQVISQLRSLIKPLTRDPVNTESPTSELHAIAPTARPYQESPPRGAAQGIRAGPPHEQTKPVHHSTARPAQPLEPEGSPHLSAPKMTSGNTFTDEKNPILKKTHWGQTNTPPSLRPLSILIIVDPDTCAKILRWHGTVFKSSRQPMKGPESRRPIAQPELALPPAATDRDVLSDRSTWALPSSFPGPYEHLVTTASQRYSKVVDQIRNRPLFAKLQTTVGGYQESFQNKLRHGAADASGFALRSAAALHHGGRLALMSTVCRAASMSSRTPLTLIVDHIYHILARFARRPVPANASPATPFDPASQLHLARPYPLTPQALDTPPHHAPVPKHLDLVTPAPPEAFPSVTHPADQELGLAHQENLKASPPPKGPEVNGPPFHPPSPSHAHPAVTEPLNEDSLRAYVGQPHAPPSAVPSGLATHPAREALEEKPPQVMLPDEQDMVKQTQPVHTEIKHSTAPTHHHNDDELLKVKASSEEDKGFGDGHDDQEAWFKELADARRDEELRRSRARRSGVLYWLAKWTQRLVEPFTHIKRYLALGHLLRTSRPPL